MRCFFTLWCLCTLASFAPAQQPGQNFDAPKPNKPDEKTLKQITSQLGKLKSALAGGDTTKLEYADVEIYAKAVEWVTRHEEYYDAKYGEKILAVADAGLKRANFFAKNEYPWTKPTGKPVIYGYRSIIDGSCQPYKVTYPTNFDPKSHFRLDVNLHGRDASLTEIKFIYAVEAAKPGAAPPGVVIDVYGRGNNAYRWAGESDIWEAVANFGLRCGVNLLSNSKTFEDRPFVLRGFSMGGAGTWHVGLHHPFRFTAIGPGAGFSTTRGYYKGLADPTPEYIERCLKIYDAVEYSENAFHVPVIAYAGDKDPQMQATKNVQERLKKFPEVPPITQIVGLGLEHKMPPEYLAKAEAEYQKQITAKKQFPDKLRFVTYTLKYPEAGWVRLEKLIKHYDRTVVEGTWTEEKIELKTTNVDAFIIDGHGKKVPDVVVVNGEKLERNGKGKATWTATGAVRVTLGPTLQVLHKSPAVPGPIDDAFARKQFVVVGPTGPGMNAERDAWIDKEYKAFEYVWGKYFRGDLPQAKADLELLKQNKTLVLFGDPKSNPLIKSLLKTLPIEWDEKALKVNGQIFDANSDVPMMIYPHPAHTTQYIVINTGHTFGEEDLKGTNATLYPRLGDFAVVKPTAPKKGQKNYTILTAGLFDENWQFTKK